MLQLSLDFEDAQRIQDFILDMIPADGEAAPRPRPAPPEYDVVISSGPDFVASRTYRGRTTTLVMLITQNQCYIRNGDNVKVLTGRRLHQWAGGNDTINDDIRPAWSDDSLLKYNHEACRNLMKIIAVESARELIKRDLLHFQAFQLERLHVVGRLTDNCDWAAIEPVIRLLMRRYDHDVLRTAVSCACRSVYRNPTDDAWVPACAVLEEADFAAHLIEQIGPDNTLKIIRAMDRAYANCHAVWHTMFHCQRIMEVLRVGEATVGNARVADHLSSMIAYWPDGPERSLDAYLTFLRFQLQVRNRIDNPLPRDLNEASRELIAERDTQINNQYPQIAAHAVELAEDEYDDGEYIIRPIRDMAELQHEANRMRNCIESYADDYNAGRCELWVMRRSEEPDKPYIDIEVRRNKVRQAFRACNNHLTAHEWAVVDEWAELRDCRPCTERNQPLAAPGH